MLEGLAAWVLNTYVGEYVENLNTDQLSIALLQGAVELENLPLKKDALKSLGLPLQVKSGFIGKITLQIPLRRLHSEPWVISIERLYLVAGPLQNTEYDAEKEKAAEAARKVRLLEALEAKLQVQKTEKQESSWFSYGTSVLANILENLQLNIKDVHIRYEDDITNPACPFSFGIVISNLSAQSTDASWVPRFVSRDNVELMHKLVDLQNFSLYFDTNTTLVGHLSKSKMADSLQREMYVSSITNQFKDHEYILSPVSARAKMKRYTTPLPLRDKNIPRNTIDLNLENMAFALSENQYRNMVLLLREFEKHEKSKRYRKWRPNCPVIHNATKWWQFAIQAKLSHIQDKNRRLTQKFITNRVKDVVLYRNIYTSQLKKDFIDPAMKTQQTRIEEEWSFDEIKIIRELVFRKLIKQGVLSKASTPEHEESTKKQAGSPVENKSLLQRWFPGWGGWYGSQQELQETTAGTSSETDVGDDVDNVGEPPPKISRSELDFSEPDISGSASIQEQELQDEVEFVLGDGEDDKSVLKRDAVFAKLNFCLNSGSFKVLGNKTIPQSEDVMSYSILVLECSAIEMMFESRPRTGGFTFGLSVGGLQLIDKMTENSQFPCLIGSHNMERFGPKRQIGVTGLQKAFRITPVQEEQGVKLFQLVYEKNPFQTAANYRFSILTQPLDIVYNKAAFRRVKEVFSSKNIYSVKKSETALSAAARRQYETLKRQTQAEFKHSLRQLLEGSEKVKRWEINLSVSAPQIIIPENFTSENTSMVVLDLGHLKFQNTSTGIPGFDSADNNEDEFLTPMSTPPNEPETSGQQQGIDIEQLSVMNLTESQILSKIYDQYTLELTDLQVMAGKMKENWKHLHHRNTTPLHLVDRFTISLQLERRLIYTADPQWPTVLVSGSLPSLTIHVNEQKVHTINACLKSLSSVTNQSVNVSSSNQSLTESSSGLNIGELGELSPEESVRIDKGDNSAMKLKEMLEESQLFLLQFTVNHMSLEIHSRDRAVAELQVKGVNTSVTKRPYDTSVKLTVHSLLVVDALQTYGQDFELLVASHKNIAMDSTSGSIRDSATTSPMVISPRSPPGSPMEQVPPVTPGGLQAVHDVVTRAYHTLMNTGDKTPKASLPDSRGRHIASPTPESEALIVVEFEMVSSNSPSNTDTAGPLNIANFQFNNLDIIANQETVVEIVSFLKRMVPKTKPSGLRQTFVSKNATLNQSLFTGPSQLEEEKSKTEVTAEFNRLSVMMMRLDESSGKKMARKVATATLSCARVQATLESELSMSGSLGGFHVYDVTPENKRHPRLFSVGQDAFHETFKPSKDMFKTADESVLFDQGDESKAFTFTFSKPLTKTSQNISSYLDMSANGNNSDCIKVGLKVASLCYTHSPKTVNELSLCLSEFKDYRTSVAQSIKSVASEVAKGMVAKRPETSQSSFFGSSSSLEGFAGSRHKLNQTLERTESEFLENAIFSDEEVTRKTRIMLDAKLDSPIIVVPKNATSAHVLVAHLGQISISNTVDKGQGHLFEDVLYEEDGVKPDRIFMEVRNMNLYSADIDKTSQTHANSLSLDGSIDYRSLTVGSEIGTPIMYDTTIHVTIDHTAGGTFMMNTNSATDFPEHFQPKDVNDLFGEQENQPMLDMKAKIQTPLKLVLLKSVYEQILQTSDYISSADEKLEQADSNINQNAAPGESLPKSTTGTPDDTTQTESLSSSRLSSLNQSQIGKAFVTKKLRLEVPLFSIELKGDFDEGETGVVELKLYRFLLDFHKDNPATTKVEVSLKSLVMDDLLESPDSPHRQIMVSKEPQKDDFKNMKPREFLSHSCPDNAIVAPVPMMPHSLPSSFHNLPSKVNQPVVTEPLSRPFLFTQTFAGGRILPGVSPSTPPPSPRVTRSFSHDEILEENLVHISVLLVDKASPEYKEKYNETKRFVDVDFNCLDTKINQQTWVVLLDFLGLGAKVHDVDILAGKESDPKNKPVNPEDYEQPVVNSEIKLKIENLSIILNKPEYQLSKASISKMNSHVSLRDGNFHMKGQLGKMCVLDLSPSGKLYKERFLTVGDQALEFDFFKYGIPDPYLQREYDMQLKLRMSSVRYTHTNKFHAEMLGFVQQFLQLQDLLGRMRAASAGKKINEEAFHSARILFDIEAGSPIILIPHSSRTSDVLVADLGILSVRNCFKFDGDPGTFNAEKQSEKARTPTGNQSESSFVHRSVSRTSSQSSVRSVNSRTGIITSRSISQTDGSQSGMQSVLSESSLEALLTQGREDDPMTTSVFGSLEHDIRDDSSTYDPTEAASEGSSVDPESPRSGSGLNMSLSRLSSLQPIHLSPLTSPLSSNISPFSDVTLTENMSGFAKSRQSENGTVPMETNDLKCLLDILDVRLCDMDLFSAERVEKSNYNGKNLHQDLEFPSCVIQRQGCKLLKEKCLLNLQIERNLDGDHSHAVPDFRVQGALSSVHCCLDIAQYKLIRGLLDHNLGEKFENFKKELLTHMQNPNVQTVLSGDVWTMISMAVDLNNVTLELLTSHKVEPGMPEVSLAKLDFIRSRLSYDLFSDQSKETDLVSKEILASDTRFRDMAINLRPSVFEKILRPTKNASPDSLQLELHYRATMDSTGLKVIINNMKLLCSFDWIIALQDFITTKPDNPFLTGGDMAGDSSEVQSPLPLSNKGSRTTSPLMTSGGIITKRAGPLVEQNDVPFELKLNVTDTEFVVVENLASTDTNAVILKCTSLLSYRPKAQDKLLSCTLQSLEIFSCSLQAEEETALSIVDPMSVTIELIPNPLPIMKPDAPAAGLVDAAEFDHQQMLLDVNCNKMNLRLSYQDMQMFLAIMDSLPKQALQAKQSSDSPVSEFTEAQVAKLMEMNFSREDCLKSLKINKENLGEAAVWLTGNASVEKPKKNETKITAVEVNMTTFCLCLIDDCLDADVPLIQLNFYGIDLKYEPGRKGKTVFQVTGDYYNRTLSGWEPLIEQWRCHAQWKNYKLPEEKLAVEISAPEVLNITVTSTLLELYNMTKDKWTEEYYKKEGSQKEVYSPSGAKRRHLFIPYAVRNNTGSPVWFVPLTVNPSHVGVESRKYSELRFSESEMTCVPPNEERTFSFQRKDKIRHKKSSSLVVNQLLVKVDGWQMLSPVSVDKVGVYFRNTLPDLSKPSIFKVNEQQRSRVVFDIQQEGTARKVITLRSALMVSNQLDTPIEMKMDSPVIPGRYEYITVNPSHQKSIPMTFVSSKIWMRPTDWPVNFPAEPISWQSVQKPGAVIETLNECKMPNSDVDFRYCVAVHRGQYPEDLSQTGLQPIPGHTVIVKPPVTVVNLLPIDLHFYFKGTNIAGDIKPGKQSQIHSVDLNKDLEVGISLENFQVCKELVVPSGKRNAKVKLRLYDLNEKLLELYVGVFSKHGGSLKLTVSASYWIVNRSGLPLVFRQDGTQTEAAGQFEENEMARIVSPFLFSFTDRECPYLCEMRVGKHKHGANALPMWSGSFSLEKEANVCQLHVVPKDGNRPDWVYSIGIEVKPGKGQFRCTSIVTLSPRYHIDNMSEHKLAIAQRHFTNKEAILSPDGHLTALPNCKMPFHWPRQDLDQLLCVKLLDVEDCNWSGGFRIDDVNSFHVNMRDGRKNSILLKVEVLLQGQTFNIIFSDAEEMPPPFRIDNMSEVPLLYFQTKTTEERLRTYVRPQTSLPFAWDEPTLEPYLTLAVANGTTATYNLDVLGEGEQLTYQNYLYICATATLPKNNGFDEKHTDLVLDCDHNFVVFRRREAGKRSQLWRMTSCGMLEHEGTGQPLDPFKAGSSRPGQRFVLDIADIAYQPGRPVSLALKKADERRAAKQTWRFENGMLFCSTGNFCVQAVSEVDGLQDGAIAILGPGPPAGSPAPVHMQMACQKLHPGSGCLTVRIQMDGPVRVVQINDVKQRHMKKTLSKEDADWEIYEESLNHKPNEKREKPAQKYIELDVNLKGGVGVSLVNKVPEELLYITLKNITLSYRSNQRGTTLEMSVANIQGDNQLFGASRTVMLYVTPTSKRDVVENTQALLISAHKLPNVGWNAEIYKHLIISMKKLTIQLEESLLWKLVQFAGFGQNDTSLEKIEEGIDDLQKTLLSVASVKTKRYYFGTLRVNPTCITLSMLKASGGLPPDLASLKKTMGIPLVNFEDADVDIARFNKSHTFESKEFFISELKKHYKDDLTGQAIKILGSVDFLGNPLGLVNDVAEGLSGLIEEGNVGGLAKGIFHGFSNSTAKVTGALSEGLSTVHMDSKHNTKRQQIRSSATSSTSQFMSGLKGLGHGLYGGVKSIIKPFEGAAEGGIEGFGKGLYQGVTGIVTKPVAGVLDFASGMSNAVRDASRRSSHMQPNRVRDTRCCHGPGGLLPQYRKSQAESQALLYRLNDHFYEEVFIAVEQVREGQADSLYVMITSHQVFFLRILDHHKENIILNIKHGDYTQCKNIENDGRYYVEISRKEDSSSIRHSSNKKPQIRCDKRATAQRVAQQINYAKNLFDDKKFSLCVAQNGDE